MSIDANQNLRIPYAMPADLMSIANGVLARVTENDQMKALRVASDIADGYIRSQLSTPLLTWAQDLRDAVCSIAMWRIMCAIGFNPEGNNEIYRMRYEDAEKWLGNVARGSVSLSGGKVEAPIDMGGPVVISNQPRGW